MKRVPVIVLVLWSAFNIGCETAVQPFVGTLEPFTVWGVLNSDADTQLVRVFTVERSPGIDRPNGIDAAVTSTNLTTGERIDWRYREVIYDDGATGHVYWAAFRPVYGDRYRLEIMRSDGVASTAEVTIPPPVEVDVNTANELSPVVRITGDAPHIIGVVVRYNATNLPPRFVWPEDRPVIPVTEFPVDVSYQDKLERTGDGWKFTIDMYGDHEIVRDQYEANCLVTDGAPGIQLRNVELRLIAADSSWYPPDGDFDPDVLAQPNVLSNVENGFGFIGAGHVIKYQWIPLREVRLQIGYAERDPCNFPDGARPIPECMEPPVPCVGENIESIWGMYF